MLERRLAAIMAADVVGYSRMMEADEVGTLAQLTHHLSELVRPKIEEHRGHVVKTTGDGLLAEFASVVEAVSCAVELQRAMAQRNKAEPDERQIRFRIGINIGDIITEGGDIFGDGVNIAARLERLADPGGICIHGDVRSQVQNRLPIAFEDMGEVTVKNIARPLRVYRVLPEGATLAPLRTPNLRARRARIAVALAVLVTLLGAGGGAFLWMTWQPAGGQGGGGVRTPYPDKLSIAVLPFHNLSNEPEQDYFAEGLTEDLTAQLSGISQLFVMARSSVLPYKEKPAKPQDVARDLGVRYVLEGSVRKAGNRVRINADLVEAGSARQLWAKQYDRVIADIFAVQDEVIGQIVSALAIELTDAEQQHITRVPTTNLEAYDYYLRAETEGYYRVDSDTFARALAFYSKAIELDPMFADAYAGYARVAVEVWRLDADQTMPGPLARKRAYETAGKALEIDRKNSRAYTVLAILQLSDGRHGEAIDSARSAVKLNPNDAEARSNLGMILSYAGQHREAVAATEEALRLDPMPPPGLDLLAGIVFYNAGQYERATAKLETVVKAWPSAETAHEYRAAALAMHGDVDAAKREIEAMPDLPQVNLAQYRLMYEDQYRLNADIDHFLKGLAAAGVPRLPYGFTGRHEDRVTGADLKGLISAKIWTGHSPVASGKNAPFILQVDVQNRVAYRGTNTFLTGEARVDNDQVCIRFESYFRHRWLCGDVFRNTSN